jgi:hypothetical protein
MIFLNGLPRISGASDMQDSAHLNGILCIFNHPQAVDMRNYLVDAKKGIPLRDSPSGGLIFHDKEMYVRCPFEYHNDCSRDQAILIMSGNLAQHRGEAVSLDYINGRDILPPSVRGLEAIAKTGKASWLSHWWLKREIAWHATLQPLEEPFQLIALCISYDRAGNYGYLKKWTESNKLWRWSIRRYLCELDGSWRDEKELCEFVIAKIEGMIGS